MTTKIIYGDRIGAEGKIRLGCSAAIFDEKGRIFLTKRKDNSQWCLPSGGVEPGESVAEGCQREVFEETSLRVEVKRLVGVYSHPDQLTVYSETDKFQIVALHFEASVIEGIPSLSDETTDFGYFTIEEIDTLDMLGRHKDRILDTVKNRPEAIVS